MLDDLKKRLFEEIKKLNNAELKGEKLNQAIEVSLAINEIAKDAISSCLLLLKGGI